MSIDNLTEALLLGSLLVVIVLALFLFSWRSALISLITIPLSLTASALVLYWRGTTINTMVLAGFVIALGAVVDDAIVDTENIVRRLRQHRLQPDGRSTARVIFDASLEVRGAVVYASMIEALALLPVFFLTGLTGAFFRPLAVVLRPGGARVDAGGADHHAGAELHPAAGTPSSSAASRRSSGGCSAATSGCSRRSIRTPVGRPTPRSALLVLLGRRRRAPARAGAAARASRSATS